MPCHVSNVNSNTSLPGWGSLLSRPVGTGRASVMGTEAIAVTSWDDMVVYCLVYCLMYCLQCIQKSQQMVLVLLLGDKQ